MASEPLDEKAIFNVARKIDSLSARKEYLRQVCGSHTDLLEQVEAILHAYEQHESFLEAPAPGDNPVTIDQPLEAPGTQIGPYNLLQQIGEGGFGIVFMAQQTEPVKRVVALKLIKAGMDSKQVIARFEAERQALALMDHPNIATILDGGTTPSGRPYFVMDLVKGVPITKYCDEHHFTPRQRLELFIPVCQAVQHAHQKGVIHRDLKPSNVIVACSDGNAVPKVIDFGVAKATGQSLTEKTLVTDLGNIVGTPEYMSPEQAEVNQLDIDTRSDIYSLGVLLYELLAGSPPFSRRELANAGILEMLRVIREQEPSKPSTKLSTAERLPTLAANRGTEPAKLTKLVRGELDWIVMKAIEKDRNRRYETANGLALDLQRYLADEPVVAGPPSAIYRFRKFARRYRHALALLTGLVLMLCIAALSLAVSAVRVWREQARTQQANLRLKDNLELALQTLDEIYLKVAEERLPNDPARKEEHLELLKKALSFYEQFAQQNSTDPEVLKAQAKAHRRAGAIRVYLDQFAEAEQDLSAAIHLYETLRAKYPDDREVRHGLATAHLNLALMQFRSGNHGDAIGSLDIGQPLLEKLVAVEPREPGYRRDLAQALNNRGTILMQQLRMTEAEQNYQRASEIWSELARERPDQVDFRAGQAEILINLGYLMTNTARLTEAEKVYNGALPLVEQVVNQDPTGAKWRRQQGVVYSNLALLLAHMGRSGDAEQASRDAIGVQQRLVSDFGTIPEFKADLALSYLNRTDVLRELGRFDDAERDQRESLSYLEKLAESFPDVPAYRRDRALNYLGLSRTQRLTQRHDEAVQSIRQAIAIQEVLAGQYPTVPDYRHELAVSLRELGGLLRERNRPDAAEAELRTIDTLEKLASDFAAVPLYRVQLAELHHERARLLRQAKLLDEAETPSVRALELWEQLVVESPDVVRHRIALGGHLNNRGQLFWDRGDLDQACEFFEKAIVQQEVALKLEPASAVARTFLRNHYSNLADVLTRRGKHAEAARAAENLPRIVPDEEHYRKAAVYMLRCVRLAEVESESAPATRAATVKSYTDRVRELLDQAERHNAESPVNSSKQVAWTEKYNTACTYALLAGESSGDTRDYGAVAVQWLQQAAQSNNKALLLKQLQTDSDLDTLRERDDFKRLLGELDQNQH